MARIRRLIPESGPLHIMCRGNNRKNILKFVEEKSAYLALLKKYKEENHISINHYCLMDNHLHLIVWLAPHSTLSRFMMQVDLAYFHYFKKKYHYCGHLWQNRFESSIIDSEVYLLQCAKYIELNPVRAGIVKYPHHYLFSSFRFYAEGENDSLITPNPLFLELSQSPHQRQTIYQKLVIGESIKTNLHQEFIGDPEYIESMEAFFRIKSKGKKRGRPKCKQKNLVS